MGNYEGEEVFTPFKSLLPMLDPNQLVIGGWDISGLNMAEAMERAKVCTCARVCVCGVFGAEGAKGRQCKQQGIG